MSLKLSDIQKRYFSVFFWVFIHYLYSPCLIEKKSDFGVNIEGFIAIISIYRMMRWLKTDGNRLTRSNQRKRNRNNS